MYVFFFKQKTAYEMRISDWSSDVCSSDLDHHLARPGVGHSLAPDDDAHTNATFPFSGLHSGHGCSCGLALLPAITTPLPPHFLQSRPPAGGALAAQEPRPARRNPAQGGAVPGQIGRAHV